MKYRPLFIIAVLCLTLGISCSISVKANGQIEKEDRESCIFDEEYIQMLYDGFVKESKIHVGIFTQDEPVSGNSLILFGENDTLLNITADGDITDPKNKIRYVDFYLPDWETGGARGFVRWYEYDRKGNKTKTTNTIYHQIYKRDGIDISEDDFLTCVNRFVEMPKIKVFDEIFASMKQKYDPQSIELEISENRKLYIFDEAYINMLYNGFVNEKKLEVDVFSREEPVSGNHRNFIINGENETFLNIYTTNGTDDPESRIRKLNFCGTSVETEEMFGFSQKYEFDDGGNKFRTVNTIFCESFDGEFIETVEIDDDDFATCVNIFMETPERRVFDDMFTQMKQKYDS